MSLIYTAIGKGDIILSEYTSYSGNFAVTAFQILKTCGTSKKYMRFSVGNYVFYTVYANVIYLIMCEREYS